MWAVVRVGVCEWRHAWWVRRVARWAWISAYSGVGLEAGLWRTIPGLTHQPVHCTLLDRELILVLEGTATIEINGGTTLDLKAGDIASIPNGALTTWHLSPDFREMRVLEDNG